MYIGGATEITEGVYVSVAKEVGVREGVVEGRWSEVGRVGFWKKVGVTVHVVVAIIVSVVGGASYGDFGEKDILGVVITVSVGKDFGIRFDGGRKAAFMYVSRMSNFRCGA